MFEIWVALVCFIAFTVLLTLKVEVWNDQLSENLSDTNLDQDFFFENKLFHFYLLTKQWFDEKKNQRKLIIVC